MSSDDVEGSNVTIRIRSVVLHYMDFPRFGSWSTNITALFDGARPAAKTEYLRGLILAGVLTASLYMIWILCHFIFYCAGRDRVGFLSGEPFRQKMPKDAIKEPTPQTSYMYRSGQDSTENESVVVRHAELCTLRDLPTQMRVLFIFCGCLFIFTAIIMFTYGIDNLSKTVVSVQTAAHVFDGLFHDAWRDFKMALGNLSEATNATYHTLQDEVGHKAALCPSHPYLQNTKAGQQLYTRIQVVMSQMKILGGLWGVKGQRAKESLAEMAHLTTMTTQTLDNMIFSDWKVILVAVPYTVIPALLVVGVSMALLEATSESFSLAIEFVISPLFFLMVAAVWAIAAITTILAGANDDFCFPGGDAEADPDATVLNILKASGVDEGAVSVAAWFVSRCKTKEDPFEFLRNATAAQLEDGEKALLRVMNLLNQEDVVERLSEYCGREFNSVHQMAVQWNEYLKSLSGATSKVLYTLSCDRIVPLYTDAVHDDVCTYIPADIFWVFCGCIVLGVCGMIMITIRASWQATVYVYPTHDSVGQVLAEDDLSDAQSTYSEPQDRRSKIEAIATVTNVHLIQNTEARCRRAFERRSLQLVPSVKAALQLLDTNFFAMQQPSSTGTGADSCGDPRKVAEISQTTRHVENDRRPDFGPLNYPTSLDPSVRRVYSQRSFSNPQSGDATAASVSDDGDAPDPPLMDLDVSSDSDREDGEAVDRGVQPWPQFPRRACEDAGGPARGRGDRAPTEVDFGDSEWDSAAPTVVTTESAADSRGHTPLGRRLPSLRDISIENDFFIPNDNDRRVWMSSRIRG